MKITKFIKDKGNKYKVQIDDQEYMLYDDVIVNNSLLLKKEITKDELNRILHENDLLFGYYESIKYINKKMRSKKEIYEYLKKKDIKENVINLTIDKLEKNNFINEKIYLKAYINDQINLTNNGLNKIKKDLLKLDISETLIDEYLENIDKEIFIKKINKYIDKKIDANKNNSVYMLKNKITRDLINLGYNKEDILDVLNSKEIDDEEARALEYEKIKRSLSRKYSGDELEYKIKEKLYKKGFLV